MTCTISRITKRGGRYSLNNGIGRYQYDSLYAAIMDTDSVVVLVSKNCHMGDYNFICNLERKKSGACRLHFA